AGFAYTETGSTTGYAYLRSPRIYISPSIISFWYLSQSTGFIDSFDVYIIKWNNQANPPSPADFINSGVRVDTKYPRTGVTGTPYIYTAYDLRGPVNAVVNDTVYVAIRYKAHYALRLYVDDFATVGATVRDLPPSISLLKGAVYHFYNGIPDTIRIIASDPENLPNVSCQVGYRYVINPNQEGNSPSGPFTEYNMTLSDANPNIYPDTFVYIIPHTNRGLRGNYYIKCTDASNLVNYIPSGAPNNWYIYNIMPTAKFAQKREFVDEERIRFAFFRNNIDLQPDLLLPPDSLVWLDSLRLWDRIYWHQNSTSALKRNKIRAYLDLGTCANRKSLVWFGNDFGYFHDRSGATDRDTIFTRNYLHFRYVSDDWTGASDVSDTILGITNRPIFGDMTYQIYTNDVYPDDIRVHPAGDENTSVAILYVKNGDSTIANPANPSIASVFYNGIGYYSIFGSFDINYVATYADGQTRVDTIFRRIHNFIPVSTCLNEVQAYNSSYNLAVDGSSPDIFKAVVRVNDPSITSSSDLRVYGYYRPFGVGSWTKVQAVYDSSNSDGYFFHIGIPVNEPASYKKDSFEVYFTAHKLNYGVYGPANTSNTSKLVYEYDVLNAPLNFQVSYRDLDSVVLVWNPPALLKKNDNQILAFQSYQVEYSSDNNNWSVIATIANINTTTYKHILPSDSEYVKYYRIRANYTAGSSPYVSAFTIYDIRAPRKIYADTFNFNIVGPNLNTQVKAVFQDFSPIKYDTIYYRTLLNSWLSKSKDNVINPDTFVYNLSITGLMANDTLFFYFKVADESTNVRITDTTKIPIVAVSLVDIPKKFDIVYNNNVLTFALPVEAKISLEVYNISGRLVFGINSNYKAGYVRFDLGSLPKGPYLIRARVDNLTKEFKTIIVK
ncbi:MAG: T9SS type A sorting domain-containing protein, partial [candidate division WOR-3 bacterium]|nr:T9SS type A sorting domain-containing protein [candidate division WOR-3 bacterium]